MAEFTEVMRQAKRMCEARNGECSGCGLWLLGRTVCAMSGIMTCGMAEEAERIVMYWAAANPEPRYPTWAEWQRANFPNAKRNICLMNFVGHNACFNQDWCDTCLNQPIPADIAEKLGVKPIGGQDA